MRSYDLISDTKKQLRVMKSFLLTANRYWNARKHSACSAPTGSRCVSPTLRRQCSPKSKASDMSVRTLVKSIQDIMRQDSGVDGDAQRISQLCWMFFLKIVDDQDQELELLNSDYRSPIPKKYQWRA